MAKKTRTELSTLAINTNLPDNTQELITPTTERSQLTDERESVVNYKDDLGGSSNAGKFVTVATDGESFTMVDEPSGVPEWVTFVTALVNQMILKAGGDGTGTTQSTLKFTSYDGSLIAQINFNGIDGSFYINGVSSQIQLTTQINFVQGGITTLRLETTGDITHQGNIMALNAQQSFNNNPLYTFKFQGKITGPSGGSFTFEEFANIKGGKENATENDKAGYLSFNTGIADGTLSEAMHISSGGAATFSGNTSANVVTARDNMFVGTGEFYIGAENNSTNDTYRQSVGSGIFKIQSRKSGTWTDRITISSGGLATFSNGIKFGGTPSPAYHSGADTLDAYEEGTFTPFFNNDGTGSDLGSNYTRMGKYTRIGNMVYYIIDMSANISSITGSFCSIGGLPYTAKTGTSYPVATFRDCTALTIPSGNILSFWVNENNSYIYIQSVSLTTNASGTVNNWDSTGRVNITGMYRV